MGWIHVDFDVTNIVLSALYALLALFCVQSILRICWNRSFHMRWQFGFYPLMICGCVIRSLFFLMAPFLIEGDVHMHNNVNFLLNELPSFIFFVDYLIVLFLWMEIYHNAHMGSKATRRVNILRPIFWIFVILLWFVVGLLFALDFTVAKTQHTKVSSTTNPVETTLLVLDGTMYIVTTIGFVIYGVSIYRTLSRMLLMTATTSRVMRRIQVITLMVAVCFNIRAIFVLWAAVPDADFYTNWWFDGVFFFFGEWIPLLLLLLILHRDPRRAAQMPHNRADESSRAPPSITGHTTYPETPYSSINQAYYENESKHTYHTNSYNA